MNRTVYDVDQLERDVADILGECMFEPDTHQTRMQIKHSIEVLYPNLTATVTSDESLGKTRVHVSGINGDGQQIDCTKEVFVSPAMYHRQRKQKISEAIDRNARQHAMSDQIEDAVKRITEGTSTQPMHGPTGQPFSVGFRPTSTTTDANGNININEYELPRDHGLDMNFDIVKEEVNTEPRELSHKISIEPQFDINRTYGCSTNTIEQLQTSDVPNVLEDIKEALHEQLVKQGAIPPHMLTTSVRTDEEGTMSVSFPPSLPESARMITDAESKYRQDKQGKCFDYTTTVKQHNHQVTNTGSTSNRFILWPSSPSSNGNNNTTDEENEHMMRMRLPELTLTKYNVHSDMLFKQINKMVEDTYDEIDWTNEYGRGQYVRFLENYLNEEFFDEGKITQFEVICDHRNNHNDDMYRGRINLRIQYWQTHCITKTTLDYRIR